MILGTILLVASAYVCGWLVGYAHALGEVADVLEIADAH